jgi:cytochrome c biogenesis protein CcdA
MNLTLLATLLGIAVLDSVNPSAIAVTLVQLGSGKNAVARSIAYILGIFTTYSLIGLVLLVAYQSFGAHFQSFTIDIPAFINNPPLWQYYLQLVLSIILIIFACFYFQPKLEKARSDKTKEVKSKNSLLGSFILGISITAIESATALPYLGAISTIYLSGVGNTVGIFLILGYNIIFVLPPLALVALYLCFGSKFEKIVSRIRKFFEKHTHFILKFGFIVLGVFLLIESVLGILN